MKPLSNSLLSGLLVVSALTLVAAPSAAQEGVLFVEGNRVGVGTQTPEAPLEVQRTDGTAQLVVEEASGTAAARTLFLLRNNGGIRFGMQISDSSIWQFAALANFVIDFNGHVGQEFKVEQDGDLVIGGRLFEGSSRSLKEDFTAVSPSQALQSLAELPVQAWSYRDGGSSAVRHVGPVAEDFHRVFGFGDAQHIAPADLAGVALLAIQGLQEQVREKDRQVADLTRRLEVLEEKLMAAQD